MDAYVAAVDGVFLIIVGGAALAIASFSALLVSRKKVNVKPGTTVAA